VKEILVLKPEGKRPNKRHSSKWVDNIRTDLEGKVCEGGDRISEAWDTDHWRASVNTVTKRRVP
jgi:hypothetical protein